MKEILFEEKVMYFLYLRTVPINEKYFSQTMKMWDKYIISGAIEIQKENWG